MIIGVDFDNVLFPSMETVLDIYNLRHKTHISIADLTTYRFSDCLESSVANELIGYFNEKVLYDCLWPIKHSINTINTLVGMGHKVLIATATDSQNLVWKEELLAKFFPIIPKEDVIKIHKKELLKLDVLIDDCLEHLINSSAEKICFNYPWNRSDKDYGIYRVDSWDEVVNIINNLERKITNERHNNFV